MSDPTVKAGIAILVLIVLSAVAFFLVARLRDYTAQDWDSSSRGLSNFEEMRLKGDISDEEFRTIEAAAHARGDGSEDGESDSEDGNPPEVL
ncbi:MAG: hypothetical protein AAFX06_25595 [Planctomycetota bacterium]